MSITVRKRHPPRSRGPRCWPPAVLVATTLNLRGEPDRQRLVVEDQRLAVEDDQRGIVRHWERSTVAAVRIEPAFGSYFVQALVAGQWIDLLRAPGEPPADLVQWTTHFDPAGDADALPSDDEASPAPDESASPPAVTAWLAPRQPAAAASGWRTALRMAALFRPFRASAGLLLLLSIGAVAVEIAPPMLQRVLVDQVLQVEAPAGRFQEVSLLLLAIVAGLLLIRLVATGVAVWKGAVASRVGTSLTAELRDKLVAKLNALPLAFHDRQQAGMLMSRVAYDTENLHTLLYHLTSGLLLQSAQMAGIGAMLFYLNPKLAAVTLLPMPLILAASWYFTRYLNPRHQHYWDAVGQQASALSGMLAGIRVVKAFVQERREVERFRTSSHRLRDSRQVVDVATAVFSALTGLLFALGGLGVWYIGGRDVLFGQMTLGSLMAFLAYLAMFYTPLTSMTEATTWFSNFITAARRIFDLLDTPGEDQPASPTAALPRTGQVEFAGVSFGYDKTRPVLKDVSFRIPPGEIVGVVGRSGSGKSTLVSLIARLYEADAGRVLVGGVDVRQCSPGQLRRLIGMVPQEPFLFRGSIAENVCYGQPEATPEQILRAAKLADAHDFVLRRPLAYQSLLGEGGGGLSGGERQRLSIARALLIDPAILILDEATASIDVESERAICRALRRFSRSRTTIAIAHRLSTLQDADRLLVFDQGRLIEQGSPGELLAQGGLYSTLVRIQGNLAENRRRVESALRDQGSTAAVRVADFDPEAEFSATLPVDEAAPPSSNGQHRPAADDADEDRCAGELRWLDPATTQITAAAAGMLRVTCPEGTYPETTVVRAFPGRFDEEYLSLRHREPSGRDAEVGLIRTLAAWPAASAAAVRDVLARRYLWHNVAELRAIHTRGQLLSFQVRLEGAAAAPTRFDVDRSASAVQRFGDCGLLLRDTQGEYYRLSDPARLPRRQRRLLNLYFGDI